MRSFVAVLAFAVVMNAAVGGEASIVFLTPSDLGESPTFTVGDTVETSFVYSGVDSVDLYVNNNMTAKLGTFMTSNANAYGVQEIMHSAATFSTPGTYRFVLVGGGLTVSSDEFIIKPAQAAPPPATNTVVTTGVTDFSPPIYVSAGEPFAVSFTYAPPTANVVASTIAADGSKVPMTQVSVGGGFGSFSGVFTTPGAHKIVINIDSLPPFGVNITVADAGSMLLAIRPGEAFASNHRRTSFPGIVPKRFNEDPTLPLQAKSTVSNDIIKGTIRISPRQTVISFKWTELGRHIYAVGVRSAE